MHIYFLGIGGAGMVPLAQIAYQAGYEVSGSDKQDSSYISYLKSQGISDITISDSNEAIKEIHTRKPIDWLVYTSAVSMEESGRKQLELVKELGVKCTKRDEFILQILREHNLKMIAVAGTHGKTTTTAMLTWLFRSINEPVSYLLPAKTTFAEMGSFNKDSRYFIYEADEFDRNFLSYRPELSVISGVSWDHHEIYKTREEYIEAFNDFIKQSSETILWRSDSDYLKTSGDNLLILDDNHPSISHIKLKGEANRRDAWLAINTLNYLFKKPLGELMEDINKFPGLSRRMEEIIPGLYSDYAHTPEKIKGAMSVASEIAASKSMPLIVIYEPLTNRRQKYIATEYKDVFKGASHVYWLPSYLAREEPGDRIIEPAELIRNLSDPSLAEPAELNDHLADIIRSHLDKGHMVVAMTGGGGNSLDDWLRDRFKPDH